MNLKRPDPLLAIIVVIIGAVAGAAVVGSLRTGHDADSFNRDLLRTANELNKNLPIIVDSETRWDTSMAGPGNKFTYVYTLSNRSKSELDIPTLQKTLRPPIIANYKTSSQMKGWRDGNVELHYQYKDKNGEFVFEIAVSPKDF